MPESAPEPIAPQAGPAGRAAGILFLTRDDEILFVHRGDGGDFPRTWAVPGGHQEEGETLEDCARREALEETGFAFAGTLEKLYDNGQFCTYLARVLKFDVKLCEESTGYSWARVDNAPTPLHPGMPNTFRVLAARTELDVAELIRDGILPSPQIFSPKSDSQTMLLNVRITGTGSSFRSKLGEHVYRDPEHYLNDRFLARCNGLAVILQHPEGLVLNSEEFDNRSAGAIMLPYVKGDEVWGIARIYSKNAVAMINHALATGKDISTSPGVVFDAESENVKVTLESGEKLLIEGEPPLLDHLALCGLGVWDKGGPAAGVILDNEGLAMADDAKKADEDMAAADKAKADAQAKADADEKAKADAEPISRVLAACDSVMKRMDAMDAREKARDDSESKAKADAEEKEKSDKAKADAEEADKAKADKEEKAMADSEANAGKYADAQARADQVYAAFGDSAPRPLSGETINAYRVRLAKKLQIHSPTFKGSNLAALAAADEASFAAIEAGVYADAAMAARRPSITGAGLNEVTKTTSAGHKVTEFYGDSKDWMAPFMQVPKCAKLVRNPNAVQ